MGLFIRTFLITVVICLGYFIWAFVGKESYEPNLKLNDKNFHEAVKIRPTDEGNSNEVIIFMLNSENVPKTKKRKANENNLENALKELVKGSERQERLDGYYSEIPKNTKLLSFKEDADSIMINLSKEFEEGGGAQSIQARLLQLVKTVNYYKKDKPVYLYIEGKKAEYIGGEGIYVEQPLNEENLKF